MKLKKDNLYIIFLMLFSCCGFMVWAEEKSAIDLLRMELLSINKDQNRNYPIALDAYRKLILLNDIGYKALSDVWVCESIPEDFWIEWALALSTRFDKNEGLDLINEYNNFVSNRILKENNFMSHVKKKFISDSYYSDNVLVSYLENELPGFRYAAYETLKHKYAEIPNFNPLESADIRADDLEKIIKFFRKKGIYVGE